MKPDFLFSGENIHLFRKGRLLAAPFSFFLQEGEILLIQGKNGCGKSSFLRLLAGLLFAAGGIFFWQGEKISLESPTHRGKIAYLGHKLALEPDLTVLEQVQKGILLCGSSLQQPFILEKMGVFGLADLASVPLSFLSQGQQQRVALCRVILSGRPVWLLDEPLNNLDETAKEIVYHEMHRHRQNGGLVALASHEGVPLVVRQVVSF